MKRLLLGAVLGLAGGALVAGITAYSGVFDVGADVPHSPLVYELLTVVRERSIERHSRDIVVPQDIDATKRQLLGAGNYDSMCAACHLRPGEQHSEIRAGLYPQPPNLAASEEANEPGESAIRFWVIKHGIKASGMPSWSKGGLSDEDIWNLVSFMKRMPSLSREDYRAMLASSAGHAHAGVPVHDGGHEGADHHDEHKH